ncbi:MAG: LysR family transcriptional regulator [Rhodoferax sp.]|nr:LysR family transcriptional regulator [Rhodoferax sp.]
MSPSHGVISTAVSRLRVRHLQTIDALARLGSLRQVALELGLTQPATLTLVNDLEHAFGTTLVERTRSGTVLTLAGAAVLARSRVALQEVTVAMQMASRSGGTGGRVRFGASPYLISALVPEVIAAMRKQWPTIELDVREGTLDALIGELHAGELDAVLGSVDRASVLIGPPPLNATPLLDEEMCVVAGKGHPLFAEKLATLAQVLAGPWALPHTNSHIRTLFDAGLFDTHSAMVTPVVECRGILNLLSIVAASGLLTIAPRAEVARKHWRGRVVQVESPLKFRAPPYVFVSRHYGHAVPEVNALRVCATAAARRLAGRG